ncbi:hypothetical protein Clacol_003154 [Clathrus columnatus]|uniref:NADP-dependent oxidoreductase domain-containing protein n=1 Tax=Clathrus columnatus TaxID=1419009 RepID=A0AAV5A866_9AGAM|nr:hypothetical protein Clacol_003154 [Clathrus columnatus]
MTKVFSVVGREPGVNFASSTPGDGPDQNGYVNQHGLSRKHIFESVKHSLERLQLDYVDLLQFHAMQNYAINNNLTPFISMQNHYSLLYREEEREMMPTLKHFGVGCIPWSPLARGLLTRPLSEQTKRSQTDAYVTPEKYIRIKINKYEGAASDVIINRVEEIAKKKGLTMAQVALAWCNSKPVITAPIVGTTSLKNLQELIDAVNLTLSDEEVKYLEEPYQPKAISGHA